MKRHVFIIDNSKLVSANDTYFMRYNISETEVGYEADEVVCALAHATYDTLVSAIIHTIYSTDAELAILANYLADPTETKHLEEYNAYQRWREEVKSACKEFFGVE